MADDKTTVVKDKPKETEKGKDHDHPVQPLDKDALSILRKTEKKGAGDLHSVELFDSARNGGADKAETIKHQVKKNDTLGHIVEQHLAKKDGESRHDYAKRLFETVAEVAKANHITDANKIKPGQIIELPDGKKVTADKPLVPATVKPADQAVKPADQAVKPADQAVKPADQVVKPADQAVKPADQAVKPADQAVKPADQVVKPADQAVKPPVDVEAMRKQADVLYNATEGKWLGTDEATTKEVLKNLSEEQRKVLNDVYKEKHGKTIDQVLRSEMSGKDLTESLTYLNAKDKQTGADKGKNDRVAEAIDNAFSGGFLGSTDKKALEEQFKGKTPAELKEINEAYTARTGRTITDDLKTHLSGSDLSRASALASGQNDDASRIFATLEEHKEWGFGTRSNANCEKDLRDTISTLNSQQIEALNKTYQERYGKSLSDVLRDDSNLPKETKDALAIYLKGTDKMTPADTLAVSDIALKSRNMDMFEEAFRSASPEARAQFLKNGGEQKINQAFGSSYSDEYTGETTYSANGDTKHAMDYVQAGKLDTATKIADNTGFFGDNEEAIEASLTQMSAAEKQSYAAGKALAGKEGTLSDGDKANVDYYNKVHGALDKAGNDREMAKWEDMISYGKDGSLVTRLAAHGGIIDDGMNKVLGTIESMPKEDWDRLKSDPEYRKKVEATLAIDLNESEMARAREVIDKKMQASTFEESKTAQRSISDAIKDEDGFFGSNKDNVVQALEKMTPDEQRRYREDPAFKKELDDQVRGSMGSGMEGEAATRILEKVARGEKPEADIVSKLEMQSSKIFPDKVKIVSDLEDAFRNDPTLRERMRHPQTPEDKVMAEKFDTALRVALPPYYYDKYATPLLETGRIPFETKAELYKGVFNDDEQGVYDALKKGRATEQDWKELLANPEKTLSFMSADEREVALNIARQKGEMKPEDELRAAMIGAGTDEAKMKEVLGGFSPEQLAAAKAAYEVKYGSNLTGDAMGELGGADKILAARELRGPQTSREAYNEARSEVYDSADGLGKFIVKHWDGTSDMTQDQLDQYSRAMGEYSKNYQEMPVEGRQKFEQDLYKSLELYQKSESAAADTLVDGAIIAAGVAGAGFTGGVSLSLLAYTGVGGALFKVGAKSAIMGNDYDFNSSQVLSDSATGAIDAATIFLGPAQAAQMLRLGEKSAITAAEAVITQLDNVAVAGGRQLLKEGAESTIKKELSEQVAIAISNGAQGVDDKAIAKIAEKIAAKAEDIPQVQAALKQSLQEAIQKEATAGLKASMREYALNSGAGALGGGLSGTVRGGVDGESASAMIEQGLMGAVSGGAMAGAFTAAFKGLGKTASVFRHAEVHPELHPEIHPELTVRAETPLIEVKPPLAIKEPGAGLPEVHFDKKGRIADFNSPEGKVSFEYHKSGKLDGEVKAVELPNGVKYSSKDGANWTVLDRTAPGGKYEIKGSMKVDAEGNMTWRPEGGNQSVLRPDGTRLETDRTTGNVLTRDVLGYVREVKTDRNNVKFDYDHDGHLKLAEFNNGTKLEVVSEGKVLVTNADGSTKELAGKLSAEDGRVTFKPESGATAQTYTPEGGRLLMSADGKQVTDAFSASGQHYQYKYDADGKLIEAKLPSGDTLKADADNYWNRISADGTNTAELMDRYKVTADGQLSENRYTTRTVYGLDEVNRTYNVQENRLIATTDASNLRRVEAGALNKVDGRPREFAEAVDAKFAYQSRETKAHSIELVSSELKDVRAIGADGKPTSAYDSLMSDKTLSAAQKQNILDNLSEVREHLASYRDGSRMHNDPEVNWIHTQGEMAKVLEVGRKANLKPDEMEDAILASMYSDSVKFSFPPPKGVQPNFFTHHLDGALAAEQALTGRGFPPERVDRIVQAIREHQIAPPEFMGHLYLVAKVKPGLDAQLASGAITKERYEELSAVLKDMTVVGKDGKPRLKPMAEVNEWPKVKNADGSWDLALTPDQKELFKLSGIDRWSVPVNPVETPGFKQLSKVEQDALISRYKISSTLIDGDGVDNYATLGGASKIVALRGPGGGTFHDGNVWKSIDSIDDSFKDTYAVLSPEGRKVADESLAQRNAVLYDDKTGIKAQMNEWLASKGLKPEEVTYIQRDGQLKYPEAQTPADQAQVTALNARLKEANVPASEAAQINSELRSLKYKGLNENEIKQYELAGEVKAKMIDLLRAGHRTDGSLPGEFPVGKIEGKNYLERLQPEASALPEAKGVAKISADGTQTIPTENGKIVKTLDGYVQVSDTKAGTTLAYDPQGRIIESSGVKGTRSYTYDSEGKLLTVTHENGAVLRRTDDGWKGLTRQSDGSYKDDVFYRGDIVADNNGSLRYVDDVGKYSRQTVDSIDGVRTVMKGDRIDYISASFAHESANLNRLARESFADSARLERFNNTLKEFESEATKRGLSEDKKALLYLQVNRLLEVNPAAVLSQSERADLAEQLMRHATHPTTVDQGANSTCNVTTLEVRNYVKDPERNAQLLADVAINGKFVTDKGITVDMTALENGLKPDAEARRALKLQADGASEALKKDGSRDWASQLTENAMVNAYWQGQSHVIMDGQRVTRWDLAYDAKGDVLGRLTKRSAVQQLFDKDGDRLARFNPGDQAYTASGKLIKNVNPDNLVYSDGGGLNGLVDPSKVEKVYDAAGKQFRRFEPGAVGYDKDGKKVLTATLPGDVRYEKDVSGMMAGEKVQYFDGQNWVQLRDHDGAKMDAPSIFGNELEGVNTTATGIEDSGYQIGYDKVAATYTGIRDVSTVDQFAEALQDLEKAGKLPAVLSVHTANPPFAQMFGLEKAIGFGGGWHVVNVHSYDPVTRTVKFSNQWGSTRDYMTEGYSIDKLFKSMKEPPLYKFMTSTTGNIIRGTAAAGAAGLYVYKLRERY